MSKVYKYKRVGARKVVLVSSIISAIIILLTAITTPETVIHKPILFFLPVLLCGFLLYSTHKKTHVTVKDGVLEIVSTKIPTAKMRTIEVGEKRIDITVEKGVFLLGTHIYIKEACFYSAQDWNDFKQDIENLKRITNQ